MWMRPESALIKPSGAMASVSEGKVGRSPRARWTLATVPFERKFLMRSAKVGSSCDGSTSWKKVRLGSRPVTTALAEISSPPARTRLATAPSLTRMLRTSASVRISAPAWRADSASARVKEPRPPWGNEAEPTGCGSAAARKSRTAVEPADQGPNAVPKIPRAATTARMSSVSKNSAANAAAGFEKIPEILGRGRIDGRRRDGEKLAKNGEEFREGVGKFGVLAGVFGGEARDAAGGFGVIVVEEEGLAVGRGSEEARIGMEHVALELLELHVRGNIGAERTDGVRERRSAKAGMKFLGDGAAADKFAALEDERLEAALGEVEGGDERIVAAADEHYALSDGHGQIFSTEAGGGWVMAAGGAVGCADEDFAEFERAERKPLLQSFRMTWLAMRPGAPMMPPPGCVAEPHI